MSTLRELAERARNPWDECDLLMAGNPNQGDTVSAYVREVSPDRILKLLDVVDAAREMRKAREGTEEHFNRRFSLDAALAALAALGDAAP